MGATAICGSLATQGCRNPSSSDSTAHAKAEYDLLNADWSGPGGIGDYRLANGNTFDVVNAAHSIRDGYWQTIPEGGPEEKVDVVIVGGGFSGLSAAFYCKKLGKASCLVLENNNMFGGEGKRTDLDVNGARISGAQGSNAFIWPLTAARALKVHHEIWSEVGLPETGLAWHENMSGTTKQIRVAMNDFTSPRAEGAKEANIGFYFDDPQLTGSGKWVKDPWLDGFDNAPISAKARADVKRLLEFRWTKSIPPNWRQWLDSMSYHEFLTNIVGISDPLVFKLLDDAYASGGAMGSNLTSAYYGVDDASARIGVAAFVAAALPPEEQPKLSGPVYATSFPGGNGDIVRHIVKAIWPDAITGDNSLQQVIYGRVNPEAWERPNQPVRMQIGAQVVAVRHKGDPMTSKAVEVAYIKGGKLHHVQAKTVVMAGGQWINKHILRDAPEHISKAMQAFYHAPILNLSIGLKNWRFLDRLGISAARWFDGFGWYANIKTPMRLEPDAQPLDPATPAMMTMYIPFLQPDLPANTDIASETAIARQQLFELTHADIVKRVSKQLDAMFGPHGFESKRDIAQIVANRWGHAFVVPPPGFYFPKDGATPPSDVLRKGYGRIHFGHTELCGTQAWFLAVREGERAIIQAMEQIT